MATKLKAACCPMSCTNTVFKLDPSMENICAILNFNFMAEVKCSECDEKEKKFTL